jgi:three-Cys-motif partner protein
MPPPKSDLKFDEIGYWTEIKLDIIRDYARAYSLILEKQGFWHAYIDAFAGSGVHLAESSKDFVPGSPLNALAVVPPFNQYYLIDLDGDKVSQLCSLDAVRNQPKVQVIHGDCNRVLLDQVFPDVQYDQYRRALCVLDPYGLHLKWEVLACAARMRSIELLLNFPIMDMDRNALWKYPDRVSAEARARLTAFWGDESWREAAYRQQASLFGDEEVKQENLQVARAFRERLKNVAGFEYVAEPLPMRNSRNAIVYYLFFASHKPVAAKIIDDIFAKYRTRSG